MLKPDLVVPLFVSLAVAHSCLVASRCRGKQQWISKYTLRPVIDRVVLVQCVPLYRRMSLLRAGNERACRFAEGKLSGLLGCSEGLVRVNELFRSVDSKNICPVSTNIILIFMYNVYRGYRFPSASPAKSV